MVDPRVIHSITIEMCTGFLLLGGTAIIAKVVADFWLRRLHGHIPRFDRWAASVSRYAEPASYFALVAGVIATFASMVTGSLAWPFEDLVASPTVHNKILLTSVSQTLFIGAVVLRTKFKFEIWMVRTTSAFYSLLVITGLALMTLQNSVAGHLAGKGSILDDFLHSVNINSHEIWVFPQMASLVILVAFPLAALAIGLGIRAAGKRAEAPAAA